MTLNEAAYNILNLIVGGRPTNNEYYSLRQIKFNIKYYRSLLIRRGIDRLGGAIESGGGQGGSHNSSVTFTELEQVLHAETINAVLLDPGNTPIATLQNTHKTIKSIPRLINTKGRSGILRVVGNVNEEIPLIHAAESMWKSYNKYNSTTAYCYVDKNRKLIIVNHILDEDEENDPVDIYGLFEDPEEAYNFNDPDPLWNDNVNEFPLPNDMYQNIVQGILRGEMSIITQSVNDTEQNTLPDHQVNRG